MKTIKILTPQNVLVEQELAGVVLRGLAFVIDQLVMIAFIIFSIIFLTVVLDNGSNGILYIYIVFLPVYFTYSLFFDVYFYGQTLGKMAVGIKVRRLDGNEILFTDAVTRWLMRIPDIFISAGALAAILINSTERQQRMGDILAGTIVIRQNPGKGLQLDNLLKISTITDYSPLYPEVIRLEEDVVVLAKQTLMRASQKPNDAHRMAIKNLAAKICEGLQIEMKSQSHTEFLRTVIKDYIVLTRS